MRTALSPARCCLDAQAGLGECPRWDEVAQRLYWVDIHRFRLHCFDPASGANQTLQLAEEIGCFALCAQGGFVAALRSGFYRIDALQGGLRLIAPSDYDCATTRFNDGRCDPLGRFWAGSLYRPKDKKAGWLYRLDPDGGVSRHAGPVYTANGLAFSPDGRYLYFADTPEHAITRYPFDMASGSLGPGELFYRFPHGQGRPDGAAVDSEGYYWCALYAGQRVVRLSPAGEVVEEIPLPVKYPTMVAFGGADLKTLYITSARDSCSPEELAQAPLSGGLFAVAVAVAGLVEPRFSG